jgi:hypothetical protein
MNTYKMEYFFKPSSNQAYVITPRIGDDSKTQEESTVVPDEILNEAKEQDRTMLVDGSGMYRPPSIKEQVQKPNMAEYTDQSQVQPVSTEPSLLTYAVAGIAAYWLFFGGSK